MGSELPLALLRHDRPLDPTDEWRCGKNERDRSCDGVDALASPQSKNFMLVVMLLYCTDQELNTVRDLRPMAILRRTTYAKWHLAAGGF
jgi:hypothetical protein